MTRLDYALLLLMWGGWLYAFAAVWVVGGLAWWVAWLLSTVNLGAAVRFWWLS